MAVGWAGLTHVWEHHVLAWACPGNSTRGGHGCEPGQQDRMRGWGRRCPGPTLTWHWPPCPEGGLAGGCPKLHLLKPLLPQHLSPWVKSPKGPRRVRGAWPECLPAAVLPRTPADQRECPRAASWSLLGCMPFPWPRTTPWGPRISTAQCYEQHCPLLGCGQRTTRVSKCPQGWPLSIEPDGLILGSPPERREG